MSFIVKNTTFPGFLDLLAPHSCRGCGRTGNALCDCCKNNIILSHQNHCPNCGQINLTGKCLYCRNLPFTFIVAERTSLIGNLVHDFKYQSIRSLAKPLAEILHATLPSIDGDVVIVPLPTISKHLRERGLDHTYLLAKHLAKLRGSQYHVTKLLTRHKNTVQVGSNRQTRLSQASAAYAITPRSQISPNATYLLLDDVWTTGASLQAAHQILQQAGAKNIILTALARSK